MGKLNASFGCRKVEMYIIRLNQRTALVYFRYFF